MTSSLQMQLQGQFVHPSAQWCVVGNQQGPKRPHKQKDPTNSMMSGSPLILGLGTRMGVFLFYVVFWAPQDHQGKSCGDYYRDCISNPLV